MNGGFNSVHGIKTVIGEAHLHEIALNEGHLVRETLLVRVVGSAVDLVVVVVQTCDVSEAAEVEGRTPSVLVEVGGQVVVAVKNHQYKERQWGLFLNILSGQGSIFSLAGLSRRNC